MLSIRICAWSSVWLDGAGTALAEVLVEVMPPSGLRELAGVGYREILPIEHPFWNLSRLDR